MVERTEYQLKPDSSSECISDVEWMAEPDSMERMRNRGRANSESRNLATLKGNAHKNKSYYRLDVLLIFCEMSLNFYICQLSQK